MKELFLQNIPASIAVLGLVGYFFVWRLCLSSVRLKTPKVFR